MTKKSVGEVKENLVTNRKGEEQMEGKWHKLLMQGVKLLPWIGKDYEQGLGYDEKGEFCFGGKKVLVLGEGHYFAEAESEQDLIDGAKDPNWTEWVVDTLLHNSDGHRWPATYHKFEHAVVGRTLSEVERQEFWNRVALYNYVQVLIGGPRLAPKKEDFEESLDALFAVLDEFRPDYVIAWGMRLYDNMPGRNGRHVEDIIEEGYRSSVYCYRVNQRDYPCLFLRHPSAPNFSIEPSHKALLKFMGVCASKSPINHK